MLVDIRRQEMRSVESTLETKILDAGYERTKDCDGNARYTKEDKTVLVSGYMVLVHSEGFWRPFPIEYALKTGIRILERLARIIPKNTDGTEDRTGYQLGVVRS